MKKCIIFLLVALALTLACGIALADDNFINQTGFMPEWTMNYEEVDSFGNTVAVPFDLQMTMTEYTEMTKPEACGTTRYIYYKCTDPSYPEFLDQLLTVIFHFEHDENGNGTYQHCEDGTSKYQCDRCAKWIVTPKDKVPRADHYNAGMEWRWAEHATCTNPGTSVYACTLCGWVDEEYTAGHVYSIQHDPQLVVVKPTCKETDIGEAYWQCSRCKAYIQFTDNTFTDIIEVSSKKLAALDTEADTGTKYNLAILGEFKAWYEDTHNNPTWAPSPATLPFEYHQFPRDGFETLPATCHTAGKAAVICQLCEFVKEVKGANPTGTNYVLKKVERNGSCFNVIVTFQCQNCVNRKAEDWDRCQDFIVEFQNGAPQAWYFAGNYSGTAWNFRNPPGILSTLTADEALAKVKMTNKTIFQKAQMHEYIISPDYLVGIDTVSCSEPAAKYYKCIFCDADHLDGSAYQDPSDVIYHGEDGNDYIKHMLKAVVIAPATGHDWTGYEYKGKSGSLLYYVRTCKVCGETDDYVGTVPPPENCEKHEPVKDEAKSTKADCTSDGYTYYKCKVCGIELPELTKVEKAGGHSDKATELEITKAPTCTEAGAGKYWCPTCEQTFTKEIPATGHKWAAEPFETKEATKTEDGYKKYKCENAGCKEIKTEVVKYEVTAPAKYELKDVKYEDGILSGKLVHVEDTLEAAELGIRVTFFNENTYITVAAMRKADGSFVAKGAGAVEHITVAAYSTEDVVTADGLEDKWFGSVSIDVK